MQQRKVVIAGAAMAVLFGGAVAGAQAATSEPGESAPIQQCPSSVPQPEAPQPTTSPDADLSRQSEPVESSGELCRPDNDDFKHMPLDRN